MILPTACRFHDGRMTFAAQGFSFAREGHVDAIVRFQLTFLSDLCLSAKDLKTLLVRWWCVRE